jgi:hypothetical protein
LSPVIIHRNMVETREDQNTVGALGIGGGIKLQIDLPLYVNIIIYYLGKRQMITTIHLL